MAVGLVKSKGVSLTGAMPVGIEVGSIGFKHQVQEFVKKILREALKTCQFNQRKTAKLLDLTYDLLRGYLGKYDLNQ